MRRPLSSTEPCGPSPMARLTTKTATFMAISAWLMTVRPWNRDVPVCTFCLFALKQSGQWKPTDAVFMHDGQM